MDTNLNEKIKKRLTFIYKDEETEKRAFELIISKLQQYQKGMTQERRFSERDCILITYGDSLIDEEQPALKVLGKFLDTYIKDVFRTIHILPMYPYTSDDGFAVVDYKNINPELGTWNEIELMSKHYDFMFDAVINHISKSSEWFQGYLEGLSPYKNYFITCDEKADYSKVIRPRNLPLLTKVHTAEGDKYVWTTFSDDQIDLNYKCPELLAEVIDILLMYVEKGASAIRLDAIGFLWKELGTGCMHLPQTHEIIKLIKDIFSVYAPGTRVVTETNVPYEENISYFGQNGDEADMVYQFPLPPLTLYTLLVENAEILSDWIANLKLPNEKVTYFNFLSSHDGIGIRPAEGILTKKQQRILIDAALKNGGEVSYKDNGDGTSSPYELNINYQDALAGPDEPDDWRIKKFLAAETILLSLQGVPGIYIHSLLGSRNDYYGKTVSRIPRRINRERLEISYIEKQLSEDTNRRRIYTELIKRLRIRNMESAFSPLAEQKVIKIRPEVLYLRRENNETKELIHVIINVSSKRVFVKNQEVEGIDLLSGKEIKGEIYLEPWECVWIKAEI